jgi:uncharacterized protein (TIGR02246 family)
MSAIRSLTTGLVLGFVCACLCPSVSAADADPLAVAAVRAGAQRFENAFASKDAKVIADDWLPDGTFIDDGGIVYVGRDAIKKLYDGYFARGGTNKIAVNIISIENPEPNVLIERGRTALIDDKGQKVSDAPYLAIHKKVGNAWPIEQLVEYPGRRASMSTPDLKWMLGKWSSTSGDKTITLTSKLSSGGKFIVSEFGSPNGEPTGDVMISGTNPVDGRLACWIFDTTGGVGRGQWTYSNGSWYLRSMRTEPNGKRVLLTHVIRPDGATAFDWKTTNRVVDGKLLADTETTHVTKIGEAN